MKIFTFITLFILSFSLQAKNCDDIETNAVDWRNCIELQHSKQLDSVYTTLLKTLKPNQEAFKAMKNTQKLWVDYRNASCYYVYTISTSDDQAICIDYFNVDRIKQLNAYTLNLKDTQSE